MNNRSRFDGHVLEFDCERETAKIVASIRAALAGPLKRQGLVVGLSGGIDSSTVAALCARAVGPERVLGIRMPDKDSSADTDRLACLAAEACGIRTVHEDITPILEGVGCYRRQAEAIRMVIPDFADGWKFKIVLPSLEGGAYRLFSVVAQAPGAEPVKARLSPAAYLGIVAATNFKQRVRKMLEYYHADRLNYAVAGTPNRLEYDQGFFVKCGDGAADLKPIAHLYKTQVFQLAAFLSVPAEIRARPPSTDTYSLPQTQEEFFFSLPYGQMDLCLCGRNHGVPAAEVAPIAGLTEEQVGRAYQDIDAKRQATRYLHAPPMLAEPVDEIK